ncbi:MAG: SGNH/GDSL hydrolase family protein [Bacteroidota bacterium]
MKSVFYSCLLVCCLFMTSFTFLAKKKRIVFFGDSITYSGADPNGFISLIRNTLETIHKKNTYEVIGTGIGGNRVPDLQYRLAKDVLAQKPDVVVIFIGVNDVWHFIHPNTHGKGTPKDQYESGLHDVINRIKKAGAKVILCTPAAIGEKHQGENAQDAMLDEYSAISRKVAEADHVPMCDLRKAFMDYSKANNPDNTDKGILTSDGVHLNATGNAFVALYMLPFLLH